MADKKVKTFLVKFTDKEKPPELSFAGEKINEFIRQEKRPYVVYESGKPVFKKRFEG